LIVSIDVDVMPVTGGLWNRYCMEVPVQ